MPGPGKYDLRTEAGNSESKYSIGRELRKDETDLKYNTPGPGKYDFKPYLVYFSLKTQCIQFFHAGNI